MQQNKHNSKCAICGNSYYLCLSCKDKMKLAPYKVHTDTAEHYKIFEILRAFNLGVIDKKTALKMLNNVDLTDICTFKEEVKSQLDKIFDGADKTKEIVAEIDDAEECVSDEVLK